MGPGRVPVLEPLLLIHERALSIHAFQTAYDWRVMAEGGFNFTVLIGIGDGFGLVLCAHCTLKHFSA